MAVRTSTIGTFTTGDIWSEGAIDSLPAGCLGYIGRTTNAGPVSTQSDVTGLALTVTHNASRLIVVEAWCAGVAASDSTTYGRWLILEGSTTLVSCRTGITLAGLGTGPAVLARTKPFSPSAGSHAYKVALDRIAGTGTVTMAASSTEEAYLAVFDVGPAF